MELKTKAGRDYGVDLLRLVSMAMVVVHHMLLYGMELRSLAPEAAVYGGAWLLFALIFPAVNVYAMISGFVGVGSRWRLSGILKLWCQVFFYSAFFFVLAWLLFPGSVSVKEVIRGFLPVSMDIYWYFTIYAALFLLMPGLNAMITALSVNACRAVTLGALVMVSLLPTVSGRDLYRLQEGYHLAWLAVMYLTGGCLRRSGLPRKRPVWLWLPVFLGSILAAWGSHLLQGKLGLDYYYNLMRYDSPAMVLGAAALVMLLAGREFPGWAVKGISRLSPLAFGVYLIHEHPAVRKLLIKGRLLSLAEGSTLTMLPGILGSALAVFVLCLVIEAARRWAFQLVKVDSLCRWAEEKAAALGKKMGIC